MVYFEIGSDLEIILSFILRALFKLGTGALNDDWSVVDRQQISVKVSVQDYYHVKTSP